MQIKQMTLGLGVLAAAALPVSAQTPDAGTIQPRAPAGFAMDLTRDEARRKLGQPVYAEAAIGDKHQVQAWNMCRKDGRIWIKGTGLIAQSDTQYLPWLSATRSAAGFDIGIEPNHRGEVSTEPAERVLTIGTCAQAARSAGETPEDLQLLPVLSVLGTTSASDLHALLRGDGQGADAPAPASTSKPASRWDVTEERDEITDEANVYGFLEASKPVRDNYGNESYPTLVLRCQRNTTSVYFVFSHFEVNDTMRMSFRLDQAAHQTRALPTSSNNKAAGLWRGNAAIPFARQLAEASRIFVRLEGRSDTLNMEFDLTGARAVLEKVSTACNWSL